MRRRPDRRIRPRGPPRPDTPFLQQASAALQAEKMPSRCCPNCEYSTMPFADRASSSWLVLGVDSRRRSHRTARTMTRGDDDRLA